MTVYWPAQRVSYCPGGLKLGFANADLNWRGVHGLRWLQVLPKVIAVNKLTHFVSRSAALE